MVRSWLVGVGGMLGFVAASCGTEAGQNCQPGSSGCACMQGTCDDGLSCSDGVCTDAGGSGETGGTGDTGGSDSETGGDVDDDADGTSDGSSSDGSEDTSDDTGGTEGGQVEARFEVFEDFADAANYMAVAVTDDGIVTGFKLGSAASSTPDALFQWTDPTGVELFPLAPGQAWRTVNALTPHMVSSDGSTAVHGNGSDFDLLSTLRWRRDTGWVEVGATGMLPTSVDGTGTLIGAMLFDGPVAFGLWSEADGFVPIDDLGSHPALMSADGTTVVFYSGATELSVYREDLGVVPLETSAECPEQEPLGLSADGSVVVGLCVVNGDGAWPATWTGPDYALSGPGVPDPALGDAFAATADALVWAGAGEGDTVPWVWSDADGQRTIRSELERAGIDVVPAKLGRVRGISPDGRSIVGEYENCDGPGGCLTGGWLARLD